MFCIMYATMTFGMGEGTIVVSEDIFDLIDQFQEKEEAYYKDTGNKEVDYSGYRGQMGSNGYS